MKVDYCCDSIFMTADERIAAIGISAHAGRSNTLFTDTDTLEVNYEIKGSSNAKFAKDDEFIIATTNKRKDITIYQVRSSLIVTSIFVLEGGCNCNKDDQVWIRNSEFGCHERCFYSGDWLGRW